MSQKILITLIESDVAPRFDLTTEVLISSLGEDRSIVDNKTMVLAHESAEDLCQLILTEEVDVLICGGIEEEFFDYLTWKKVNVLDSVMGPWERALDRFRSGDLDAGAILYDRPERKSHV
ncbi:MAG: dinitrogenase iron-molybdenum cofactor biosynthesis protein [Deltaproteobacteria bacterium]|nr:dinitrogenase iron-molybdenum cofactor biosynthesis protein [Deltaproteobacteria bacterium]